jgi:DNA-binding NarL/FixJ family response regulator
MHHRHLRHDRRGSYLRTNATLANRAATIAVLRRSGVTIRAIAASVGMSRSGVQGVLARVGLAGVQPQRSRHPVVLSRRAADAVALLVHPLARRLTWRQRVVLQGRVRGLTTDTIAAELGIQPASVSSLVATARRRLGSAWRRRSRARRSPPADMATLLDVLGHDHIGKH